MKKLFTLLTLALLSIGTAWATIGDTFKLTCNGSFSQTTAGYFTITGSSFNTKFTGASYDGVDYTSGFKMESSSAITWTAEAEHTVTILQSDWESKTVAHGTPKSNQLDGVEIPVVDATSGTNYKLYTIEKVAAGTHTITRKGGENGIFMVKVVYTSESVTVVALPVITWNSSTNKATITCATDGATIYYTTDGSEPTSGSSVYSAEIPLTNSTTVRAIAIKSETSSSIAKLDCYVSHPSAVAVLGYNGGTREDATKYKWTSSDNSWVITMANQEREMGYVNLAGSQDGFKLNANDVYTLKVSNNVKVTKIVVVGKTWLTGSAGNASTIAIDGFTPASGAFYDYPTDGETYVKTIEFTPESELGYGASVTLRPGNNQLGAYIEIYGTEYAPAVTAFEDPRTWDFTNWSSATKTTMIADTEKWNQYEKANNGGTNFGDNGRSNVSELSTNTLKYNTTNIPETSGLKFTAAAYGLGLIFDINTSDIAPTGGYHGGSYIWLYGNNSKIIIPSVTKGSTIEIGVESHKGSEARTVSLNNATQTQGATSGDAAKVYQVCKWTITADGDVTITPSKGLHIYYITLKKAKDATTITPAYDKTTYVTTKALDFSKASDGLKAYAATAAANGSVTLEEVGAVPAGTPVMLIGTAGTEYSVPVATSASAPAVNMFLAGDGTTEFDGSTYDYILASDGLFHQISSGSVAVGKAYLHCTSDPTTTSAPYLTIDFGNTTGIGEIKSQKVENGQFFDLQGRKVAQPTKGLYIVNGRKVVIK